MQHPLVRLELQGFKSFAESTTLDLPGRLTGVVGPNGSGKSNIVDALRWVLGERSAHELRGEGAEQLIFAGSERRPRASLTRVAAVFRNDSRFFPIDADEVILERRVAREGTSQMYLNGAEVKLADIAELLARARLGPRSFAIVGQGEADLFVRATPEERRALIEELLGLNEFRIKKRRSERRLVKSRANMEAVSAQVKELEPHLGFLRRQKRKWERRDAMARELAELAASYFGGRLSVLQTERGAAEEEERALNEELKAQETAIRTLERDMRDAERDLDAAASPRRVSAHTLLETVRAFVQDAERALKAGAERAAAYLAEWVRRFEELTKSGVPAARAPLTHFKETVSGLEAARAKAHDIERRAQEARFALTKVGMKEEELAREMEGFGVKRHDIALSTPGSAGSAEEMRRKMLRLEAQLAALGDVDEAVMREAEETEERHAFLTREMRDLEESSQNLYELIRELDRRIHGDFRAAFQNINRSFGSYFQMMFGGGKAKLELVGEGDESGVELTLTVPKKRSHGTEMLSGGERTLVSLAALFALISVSPPPFLALDEIDAALDEANAGRFARLLREFSAAAQFVIVTHNRITIDAMEVLYGVTMEEGVSRVLSMKVD